ncbi:TPA: HipA domain-containing protein [Burkholderia aenigmatica]|uniref:HipA domain-containing protein n=1 Tax=Burkholderia sp. AU45251 TaxID=3059204 RepID=UPI0026524140|nr:HipA domain-containing protein [Burkholderia sp. AU45251]HDR9487858.1 HipA domain-containing protein [Burkholderia aenigmatica]MDN7520214.1 HipA domain-containing protein [Burkholderia sp. AU45251]HDR9519575.1 HipA domain-containing protein [Burkholderia aenigmatica]HDR9596605.1 HipA domain-containing protein [Burkholderia aenigmatica]HDR9604039.1 HipA domain-containing protein [Burkholderia aenigmatica]
MVHRLRISTNGSLVGQLTYDARQDDYGFSYDPTWQARADAFALSPCIPLDGRSLPVGAVQRFIGNLLPEGRALEVAAAMYQLSKDNVFGLIRMLGKEPVGALSFLPDDGARAQAPDALESERRVISAEELTDRIRKRDTIPFPVWDGRVRLSIAGHQDKLQVLVEGEQFALVEGALSSTHILKPESGNPHAPFMVANEHFCMTLAARMGLPVAPVEIRRIPEPILLIERFDRIVTTEPDDPTRVSAVRRLHVIDGCQALDLPATLKYERNLGNNADVRNIREGVSFEKLFSLTPCLETPAAARTAMLRWALLQLLIGNSDAHGKNISFFVSGGGLAPAPLYDLVCVNVYGDAYVQDMAMAYGDVFRTEELTAFALADFAHRTQIRPSFVAREMSKMASLARTLAPELAKSDVYAGDERGWVGNISEYVCAQADRVLRIAPMVSRVNVDLL